MSAESDLRALLLADAGVSALVGSRVRAGRAEEDDARPYVVFSREDTEREETLSGEVVSETAVIAVECWADSQGQADAVADAVDAALRAVFQPVANRSTDYDGQLDFSVTVLTVRWDVD